MSDGTMQEPPTRPAPGGGADAPAPGVPFVAVLHIPKTGGNSVAEVVGQLWPPDRVWWPSRSRRPDLMPGRWTAWRDPGFARRHDVMGGHYPVDHPAIAGLAGREVVLATVFRDPVARAVSWYDDIRRRPDHHRHEEFARLDLWDALHESDAFREHVVLGQFRYAFGGTDRAAVQRALRRRRYLIGRLDALPAFVAALAALAGRDPAGVETPRRNTAAERAQLLSPAAAQARHDGALRLLREWNREEIAFLRRVVPVLATPGPAPRVGPAAPAR